MKKYIKIMISEAVIFLAFLFAIIISFEQQNEQTLMASPTSVPVVPGVSEAIPSITPNPTFTTQPDTSDCAPSVTAIPEADDMFAEITIYADNKTRTYEVMPDVDEETLKDNVGWLPSSSLPYEDGACILMGHRDTDFKILKNCSVGNQITVLLNNIEYNYTVSFIEIVDSNDALKFNTNPKYSLILVTCYPFYYTGHAPKKILFYCTKSVF